MFEGWTLLRVESFTWYTVPKITWISAYEWSLLYDNVCAVYVWLFTHTALHIWHRNLIYSNNVPMHLLQLRQAQISIESDYFWDSVLISGMTGGGGGVWPVWVSVYPGCKQTNHYNPSQFWMSKYSTVQLWKVFH